MVPNIAVIIGSSRPTRFADKPAQWFMQIAKAREDMEAELVDLRDFDLPLFAEKASNLHAPSEDPRAVKWQQKMAGFDGYVWITAEYNHSLTGSMKNALDQAYKEWIRKPVGAVGYGGVGGARAVEHLRTVAVELQMVPVRNAVHIGAGEFMKVSPMGKDLPMSEIADILAPSAKGLLDDIVWWANATRAAR